MRSTIVVLFSGFLLLLSGCGSVSRNTQSASASTQTQVLTQPLGASSTTTSTASANRERQENAGLYLATMYVLPGREPSLFGPISLNMDHDDGSGSLQLSNLGIVNTTLLLQFCPYPQDFGGCINITSLATDATGKANISFTFPQHGTYSGIFALIDTNGSLVGATSTGSSGISFQSALLPAARITGGIQLPTGHAPGRGTVVVNGTTAHITLIGATPNHTFTATLESIAAPALQGIPLANVTTDAHGNASVDVGDVQAAGWSTFLLTDSDGVEFINAFQVKH